MAPNKIIFQIGVLAFCVSAVFLGIQNLSLMETVSRSFIVFVGVILTVALVLFAGSMFVTRDAAESDPADTEKKQVPRDAGKVTEKSAKSK